MKRALPTDVLQLQRILQNSLHPAFELKLQIDRNQALQLVEFCESNGFDTFNKAFIGLLTAVASPIKELAFARALIVERDQAIGRIITREYQSLLQRITKDLHINDEQLKQEIDRQKFNQDF